MRNQVLQFPCISTYSEMYISVFSPNVEKCGKNADQNNSEYGQFLGSETQFGMVLIQVGILKQSSGIWFLHDVNVQAYWKISRVEFVNGNLRSVPADLAAYFKLM